MRLLGIIFFLFIVTVPFLLATIYIDNGFLQNFIKNQSVEIMGTILALNVTTSSFLIAHINSIELQKKKRLFDNTIREIKHNIILMFVIFLLHTLIIFLTPNYKEPSFLCYALFELNLLFFIAYIYALWEIIDAIFSIRRKDVLNSHENV